MEADAPQVHEPRHRMSGILGSRAAFIVFLLLFTLLVRAISFFPSLINPDESVFALAAREVLYGNLPYLTLFDNKPVGSTLIIALAYQLLGESVFTVRLVGALCVWISSVLIAVLAERGGLSRLQALGSALLYVVFASMMGGFATLTEILLTPFTLLAVLLLYRTRFEGSFSRRLVLISFAGLACGIAIAIKIVPLVPGFAVAGFVLLSLVVRREVTIFRAILLGAAFTLFSAIPMGTAAAVFAGAGKLPDFLYSNFGFAQGYSDITPSLKIVGERLATVIDSFWPLLGLAVVAMARLISDLRRRLAPDGLLSIAAVWLMGEVVAAAASGHYWPHYFLSALPPLVLMAAFAIETIVGWIGAGERRGRAIALLTLIAVLIPLERTQMDALRKLNRDQDVPRQVAAAIRRASDGVPPTLFVTNYHLTGVYSLTGAPLPPTRYVVAPHLFSRQSAMIQADPVAEVARVLASRPRFIVIDNRDSFPQWARAQLDRALAGYDVIHTVEGVSVYQAR